MNLTDSKVLHLIDILKAKNKIRYKRDFCKETNISEARISRLPKESNLSLTTKDLSVIIDKYKVNANWLFGLSNEVFLKEVG
jgi:hypothetical protein